MNHLERIAAHLGELDAVLLTSESNCYYATGFLGEGAALVTRKGSCPALNRSVSRHASSSAASSQSSSRRTC